MRSMRLLMGALLTVIGLRGIAAPVTGEQARATAQDFALRTGRMITVSPAHRAPARKGMPVEASPYYAFNFDGERGFVIVSGDDRTAPILGYTETGSFNTETMPENLRGWLEGYADEIAHLDDSETTAPLLRPTHISGPRLAAQVVNPLIRTTWNQGTPYNNRCPVVEGSRCPTGCTATAMAQVMYYHRWPTRTTAIPSHTFDYNGQQYEMAALPATALYWSGMRTNYQGNETTETYVATLMLYAGQGARMGYTPGGSGASFGNALNALRSYFDYDVQYLQRSNYSIAQWESIIATEIENKRPVLYEGYSSGGGHAFVCDGIDAQGFYHFNWGWGGWCDGYFRLSVLNPDDNTGIGASATKDGYSMGQGIIIGWNHASEMENPNQDIVKANITNVHLEGNDIKCDVWNNLDQNYAFDVAVAQLDEDNNVTQATTFFNTVVLSPGWGYTGVGKNLNELRLPEGTYHLAIASRQQGTTEWYLSNTLQYVVATYNSNRNLTNATAHPQTDVERVDFEFPGNNMVYELQRVQATIHNRGDEINAEVRLFSSTDPNKPGSPLNRTALFVESGGEETLSLYYTPEHTGEHTVWLALDDNCQQVIGKTTYKVNGTERLTTDRGVATFYSDWHYEGTAITLPEGRFTLADMQAYGIRNDDISSLRVVPGFRVTCYDDDGFGGQKISYTTSSDWIGTTWNDRFSSLVIEAEGTGGLSADCVTIMSTANNNYWDFYSSTREGSRLQQRRRATRRSQLFALEETGEKGIYNIRVLHSDLYVEVQDTATQDGTYLAQMPRNEGNPGQEFILIALGGDTYQIAARYCGKVVEIPNESTIQGEFLVIRTNEGQSHATWSITETVDGIEGIGAEEPAEDFYYDLSGRATKKPATKGIYVTGGKKVVVR